MRRASPLCSRWPAPSRQRPRPDRSVVFLAVTAEEKGLLGSEYYAANPLYPLAKTVGMINTDALGVAGPARNFSISGAAKLGLLDDLIAEGRSRGRTFMPEPHPEAAASIARTISPWPSAASRPFRSRAATTW
jgi:Zn-dependent M28 family amino/carboxypeptidase